MLLEDILPLTLDLRDDDVASFLLVDEYEEEYSIVVFFQFNILSLGGGQGQKVKVSVSLVSMKENLSYVRVGDALVTVFRVWFVVLLRDDGFNLRSSVLFVSLSVCSLAFVNFFGKLWIDLTNTLLCFL